MTLSPGSKLGPYEILESIGSGGMGEVWKARDTRLGRIVAIKKVREQHSERFKQEARFIAALNHPNICQIFDIGDDYLVLEYVDGKALSSPLPEQEAVKLAIQIVTALEAAHKKGIIHRDLKPSNIMVSDEGTVKLLDFGLAKLYEQDQSTSNLPTEEFPATQAGAILGTVAYMSPEQAQGQPADVRSDIFSFGLVLYEMLSGRRAFSGDSTPETMAALLRDEPAPLKTSPALEKIVKRCLEKNPSDRFQRMSELKVELVKATAKKMEASSEEPQPSIAVLPFVNMSGDKEQEYFSDGLAEEIINALTNIPGLKVIARTSSFYFRDKDVDIGQIRERLKVQNILEGSVRKSGTRIRVTAQLIETANESHIWSERFDRDLTDIFAIQDEISQSITEKLQLHLNRDHLSARYQTKNIEAHNLLLKARHHYYKYTRDGLSKAKEYIEQVIALDSKYALAWSYLAWMYWMESALGFTSHKSAIDHSKQAAIKSQELDNMLPNAHSIKATLYANDYDWISAELEFRKAIELEPGSADIWAAYSDSYLTPMRRLDEAVEADRKSIELDPLSPAWQYNLGYRLMLKGQYDRAIEYFKYALELDPQYPWAYMMLGFIHSRTGHQDDSVRECETGVHHGENIPVFIGFLGLAEDWSGRIREAQKLLGKLQERAREEYIAPSNFGHINLGMGDIDKAFEWYEKAIEERDPVMRHLHVAPMYDPLRSHPRYEALLRKMNLEP